MPLKMNNKKASSKEVVDKRQKSKSETEAIVNSSDSYSTNRSKYVPKSKKDSSRK
jgi:ABC-type transporter lipoprotein component MlaA